MIIDYKNAACEDITADHCRGWCGIQGDFLTGAWQWKTSDVMLRKIFDLANKSDMSTKNFFFMDVILCICGNRRNIKCTVIGQAIFHFTCNTFVQKFMYCINTNVHILFFYALLTLLNKYLIFLNKTLISIVDCHGEKKTTKHFDQCGSNDNKNTWYFGGLGQITNTITRFWSKN